jgi:hypothetical protein
MKKHIGRRAAVVGAGTGLFAYLLIASIVGRGGGALCPAWGQSDAGAVTGWTPKETISLWPETAKKTAGVMLEEYGPPDALSGSSLAWFGHGAWKRTVVYRDGWVDQASVLHPEVLEQVISYRTPRDRIDDLARFDSRLNVDSAKHELTYRSDSESTNYLAINLAAEIATRLKTVAEAKAYALKVERLAEEGKESEYTKRFLFQAQNGDDAIPD